MRRLLSAVSLIPAFLCVSFLLGYLHPFGDADLFRPPSAASLLEQSAIPLQARAVLIAKCADCHSLATRTPLYAHFAPASWLIERDIVKGRSAMNLSQWDRISACGRLQLLSEIAHEVKRRRMPPAQYLALHFSARLSPEDIVAITGWSAVAPSGVDPQASVAAAAGDPERGRIVFDKRCAGCHALAQDREGPHLAGVYGRTAGSVTGFDYSGELKNSHIVWDEATLDRWLTDPQTMVPGANMDFFVAKPQERADVIAYLKRQSPK